MKAKQEIQIEAINLRTIKLNGYKLLSVYSKEYGLMKLSGSKLGGRSEPFVRNYFWISGGSNEIHNIKQSEFISHFKNLSLDLDKLTCAWQFAEFLEACSHFHEEKSPEIFNLFIECLTHMDTEEVDLQALSNYFLWQLSEYLGYKPHLTLCELESAECKLKQNPELEAWFDFEQGGVLCKGCSEKASTDSVRILPGIYKLLNSLDGANHNFKEKCKTGAVDFVNSLLKRYLQKHTSKKMKSLNISKQLK